MAKYKVVMNLDGKKIGEFEQEASNEEEASDYAWDTILGVMFYTIEKKTFEFKGENTPTSEKVVGDLVNAKLSKFNDYLSKLETNIDKIDNELKMFKKICNVYKPIIDYFKIKKFEIGDKLFIENEKILFNSAYRTLEKSNWAFQSSDEWKINHLEEIKRELIVSQEIIEAFDFERLIIYFEGLKVKILEELEDL